MDLCGLDSPFRCSQFSDDKEKGYGNVTSWLYEMKTAAFLYSSERNFNFLEKTKTGSSSYRNRRKRQDRKRKRENRTARERVRCIHGIPPTRSSAEEEPRTRLWHSTHCLVCSRWKKRNHTCQRQTRRGRSRKWFVKNGFHELSMIDRSVAPRWFLVTFYNLYNKCKICWLDSTLIPVEKLNECR